LNPKKKVLDPVLRYKNTILTLSKGSRDDDDGFLMILKGSRDVDPAESAILLVVLVSVKVAVPR